MSCLFNSLSYFINIKNNREAAAGDTDSSYCIGNQERIDFGPSIGRRAVDGNIMRSIICDYLEKDPIIFDDMNVSKIIEPDQINGYVENMRNENTYGGALEIKSFCKIFNLNVLIKSIPNNRDIEFLENREYCYIGLYWTGDHFEPIVC